MPSTRGIVVMKGASRWLEAWAGKPAVSAVVAAMAASTARRIELLMCGILLAS